MWFTTPAEQFPGDTLFNISNTRTLKLTEGLEGIQVWETSNTCRLDLRMQGLAKVLFKESIYVWIKSLLSDEP